MNENEYHFAVIRSHLMRGFETMCPAIRDEIATAFDEALDLKDNGEHGFDMTTVHLPWKRSEWRSVPALSAVRKVVCRASNRVFVGLPLCMFVLLPKSCTIHQGSRWRPWLD